MDFLLVYWMDSHRHGLPPAEPNNEGDCGGMTVDRFKTREDAVARARELFSDPRASYLALHGSRGLFLDTRSLAAEAGVSPPVDRRVLGAATSAA